MSSSVDNTSSQSPRALFKSQAASARAAAMATGCAFPPAASSAPTSGFPSHTLSDRRRASHVPYQQINPSCSCKRPGHMRSTGLMARSDKCQRVKGKSTQQEVYGPPAAGK
ncbi:unnamed protein product [Pleuronectes platessa]|uniref:Uncharacterized protein n=1 Tax=Pleuronectes platessa TaxID=8262 RepID=A0A9N7U5N3_PLEPL|nr:unnamed protein product [Pleuronectes platessa]